MTEEKKKKRASGRRAFPLKSKFLINKEAGTQAGVFHWRFSAEKMFWLCPGGDAC